MVVAVWIRTAVAYLGIVSLGAMTEDEPPMLSRKRRLSERHQPHIDWAKKAQYGSSMLGTRSRLSGNGTGTDETTLVVRSVRYYDAFVKDFVCHLSVTMKALKRAYIKSTAERYGESNSLGVKNRPYGIDSELRVYRFATSGSSYDVRWKHLFVVGPMVASNT